MELTASEACWLDRTTPVKPKNLSSRHASSSLWSPKLGPATPQQASATSGPPSTVVSEGRGRRRRLYDEYEAMQSGYASRTVLQTVQGSPSVAAGPPDLFADECLFQTPPPQSRKRRSMIAPQAEHQPAMCKTAPACSSLATVSSPDSCANQACQLSFTPEQIREAQPNAVSTPAAACSRRSMKFEDLPAPESPFRRQLQQQQQAKSEPQPDGASGLTPSELSDDEDEDQEAILPSRGLAVHKSASFHDWLDHIVAMVSPSAATSALDDVTAAIDSSSNADAEFSLAPSNKKLRNPSLLEILAASLESYKPSRSTGSARSSDAEGASAGDAPATKPVQHSFVRGVASFSDMVAAGMQ